MNATSLSHQKQEALNSLLKKTPQLWRAGTPAEPQPRAGESHAPGTGYAALDAILPGQNWPDSALTEIISPCWGIGELQLLLPLMRSLISQQKWIMWVSPPYELHAPALLQAGIDTRRIIVVRPETSCQDALWTVEKALQTESCGLVLAWQNWLPSQVLRRLQLAAHEGRTRGVLFHNHDRENSPSSLRLQLSPGRAATAGRVISEGRAINVQVLKARGSYRKVSALVNLHG